MEHLIETTSNLTWASFNQKSNTMITNLSAHILLILLNTVSSVKLLAYDCSMKNGAKFAEVSLLDVAPCNNISARYDEGKKTEIQILQEIKTKAIEMNHCQLRVSIETAYCGKGVYSRVWNGIERLSNEPVRVTEEQCSDAFITKKLKFDDNGRFASKGSEISVDLRDDLTGDGVIMLRGNESLTESYCTSDKFTFLREIYTSHLLRLKYHAVVQRKTGILHFKKRKIMLTENLATHRIYDGKTYDTKHGSFFWNPIILSDQDCHGHVEVMKASGTIYKPKKANGTNSNTIILIIPDGTETKTKFLKGRLTKVTEHLGRQLAITLNEKIKICGKNGYTTHIPEIKIILSKDRHSMLKIDEITGNDVDKLINLKATLGSTYLSSELRTSASFDTVAKSLCEQSRSQIFAKLAQYGDRHRKDNMDTRLKGKHIIQSGSMLYMLNCQKTTVTLRKNESKCFEDVPVIFTNNLTKAEVNLFLNPITYNLKPSSRAVECSTIIPNKFGLIKENGKRIWICLTPKVMAGSASGGCQPPPQLQPLQIDPFFSPNMHAIDASLYNNDQLAAIDEKQWDDTYEVSSVTEFVRLMGDSNSKDQRDTKRSITNLMENIMKNSKNKVIEGLFPTFFKVIIYIIENLYNLMLISFTLNVLHGIICWGIRTYKMYKQEKGISCKMILTLTGGLFLATIPLKQSCKCDDDEFLVKLKTDIANAIKEDERKLFINKIFS